MTQTDDFIDLAERQLAEIVRDETALAQQEEGVRRKRQDLQQRMADIRASVRVYRELMGLRPEAPTQPIGLFDDIPMGTIADMAYAVLRKQGEPMKVADLARVLAATGKLRSDNSASHQNYGTVYGTLKRDRRFRKLEQGRFGIDEQHANGTSPNGQQQPASLFSDVPQG